MASTEIAVSEKRGRGRLPMPYDAEIAEEICVEVAMTTAGLATILREHSRFPSLTVVMRWLQNNNNFNEMYARAKEFQADMMGEEILEIVDAKDLQPHDKRVRMDGRRFLMAKLRPRKYGDSIDITSGGEPLPAPPPIVIDQRIQAIMLAAGARRDAERLLED